jgi:hypothetical protein
VLLYASSLPVSSCVIIVWVSLSAARDAAWAKRTEFQIANLNRAIIENMSKTVKSHQKTQIILSGSLEEVVQMIELVAWLTATFTLSRDAKPSIRR